MIPGFLISIGAGQVIPFLNLFVQGKFGLDLTRSTPCSRSRRWARRRRSCPAAARPAVRPDHLGRDRPGRLIPFLVVLGFSPVLWTVILAMAVRNSLMNAGNPIFNAFAMEQVDPRRAGHARRPR